MNAKLSFVLEQLSRFVASAKYYIAFVRLYVFGGDYKVGDLVALRGNFAAEYYQVIAVKFNARIVLRPIALFIRPASERSACWQLNAAPARNRFIGAEETHKVRLVSTWVAGWHSVRQDIETDDGRFYKAKENSFFHLDAECAAICLQPFNQVVDRPLYNRLMSRIPDHLLQSIVTPDFSAFVIEHDRMVNSGLRCAC